MVLVWGQRRGLVLRAEQSHLNLSRAVTLRKLARLADREACARGSAQRAGMGPPAAGGFFQLPEEKPSPPACLCCTGRGCLALGGSHRPVISSLSMMKPVGLFFFTMILTDSAFTDITNEKTPELEKIRPGFHILWSVSSSFVIFVRGSGCLAETPCPVSLPVPDS